MFAFINPRAIHNIEVYGHCADEYLNKLQTLQKKLLQILSKLDRRTFINQLQYDLPLLRVSDINFSVCFVL